jgi:predicted amidohydrolase YtcJ
MILRRPSGSLRLLVFVGAASCLVSALAWSQPADVVFTGPIVTLSAARPTATALAVRDGRIVAIGDDHDVAPFVGTDTARRVLPGVAVPGLADAHVHPMGLGEQLEWLDLRGLDKREILSRVAAVAGRTPEGVWIRGEGWDQGFWRPPEFPTAAELDAVTTRHPVVLDRIDGHSIWVNSLALSAAGITGATPDPVGGKILRGDNGAPTGVLVDHAVGLLMKSVPAPTPADSERRLRAALARYVQWGLTSVHDAGADLDTIHLYEKFAFEHSLPLRAYVMARGTGRTAEETLARGPEIDLGGGRLTIRSFKVVLDGALGSRGAELFDPYADAPGERGLETMSDDDFRGLVRAAAAKGFQVNAHAIGDRAVRRALDVFESAGPDARRLRFRVEHASVVDPSDRTRFARLGVIASVQPVFVGEYSRWADDRVGPSRAGWVLATKSLLDAGASVALGTDYPASDSGDPLANLFCAVTRRGADGTPARGWHVDERVDTAVALAGMTSGAAFAAFQEKDLGALTVGRYADFTVLSRDPLTTAPADLGGLEVRMTVVGGEVELLR